MSKSKNKKLVQKTSESLLSESQIRRFMGLAGNQGLSDSLMGRLSEKCSKHYKRDDEMDEGLELEELEEEEELDMEEEPAEEMPEEEPEMEVSADEEMVKDLALAIADAIESVTGVDVEVEDSDEEEMPSEEELDMEEEPAEEMPEDEMDEELDLTLEEDEKKEELKESKKTKSSQKNNKNVLLAKTFQRVAKRLLEKQK